MRRLRSNFPKVKFHLPVDKPNFRIAALSIHLFHCTNPQEIHSSWPLIIKHGHRNYHNHRGSVHIKDGFPCDKDHQKREDPATCFRMAPVSSINFIFTLYCPHNDGIVMPDRIAETIEHPPARFLCCGDFNSQLELKNEEGRYCRNFSVVYKLTQIIEQPNQRHHNRVRFVFFMPSQLCLFFTKADQSSLHLTRRKLLSQKTSYTIPPELPH